MSYTPGDEFDNGRISTCCGATMLADIDRCSDCREWDEGRDLEDDEVPHGIWLAEMRQMKRLYDGEVRAGLHVPPGRD